MKSFLLFFCLFFLVACGDTIHNHYYIVNDDEAIPCPDNDCEGIFNPDENSDGKTETENEQPDELTDYHENDLDEETADLDSNTEEPDEILPDEDAFVDYCFVVVDKENKTAAGEYSSGTNTSDTSTILIISMSTTENGCEITFFAPKFPEIHNLIIFTTAFPITNYPLQINGVDCKLSAKFLNNNYFGVQISETATLDRLFDETFKRK